MTEAELTRAQREALEVLRKSSAPVTATRLAQAIYNERNPHGRAWTLLSVEQRRPRVQAATKHIEFLLLHGFVETVQETMIRYAAVPEEAAK